MWERKILCNYLCVHFHPGLFAMLFVYNSDAILRRANSQTSEQPAQPSTDQNISRNKSDFSGTLYSISLSKYTCWPESLPFAYADMLFRALIPQFIYMYMYEFAKKYELHQAESTLVK